ncbi:hypothetical protein, partial [Desertimonas flava]|uniref:hypothetical protein n=1 Tax=Desertimonas flava TaxID=2064846 RepID=UPI0023F02D67
MKDGEPPARPAGATCGVVVCFSGCAVLPTGSLDAELAILHFTALSAPDPDGPPVTTALDFCDT